MSGSGNPSAQKLYTGHYIPSIGLEVKDRSGRWLMILSEVCCNNRPGENAQRIVETQLIAKQWQRLQCDMTQARAQLLDNTDTPALGAVAQIRNLFQHRLAFLSSLVIACDKLLVEVAQHLVCLSSSCPLVLDILHDLC